MRRRDFVAGIAGSAAAWPLAARAQQAGKLPTIGFLHPASPDTYSRFAVAFQQGLREAGYVDGRNAAIEYRWANDRLDQLAPFALDLVQRRVNIIATFGNVAARSAKVVTATIPIIFLSADDPIRFGLVASFNRPSGNMTGVSLMASELISKRFELLHELVPNATTIGLLANARNLNLDADIKELQAAAHILGLGQRFRGSNHIRRPRRACRTRCG